MGSTDFFGYMCHGTEQGRVLKELLALTETGENINDIIGTEWEEVETGLIVHVVDETIYRLQYRYTELDIDPVVCDKYTFKATFRRTDQDGGDHG